MENKSRGTVTLLLFNVIFHGMYVYQYNRYVYQDILYAKYLVIGKEHKKIVVKYNFMVSVKYIYIILSSHKQRGVLHMYSYDTKIQ